MNVMTLFIANIPDKIINEKRKMLKSLKLSRKKLIRKAQKSVITLEVVNLISRRKLCMKVSSIIQIPNIA